MRDEGGGGEPGLFFLTALHLGVPQPFPCAGIRSWLVTSPSSTHGAMRLGAMDLVLLAMAQVNKPLIQGKRDRSPKEEE